MESKMLRVMTIVLTLGFAGHISAKPLSIYEIQFTTEVDGTSPENGNIIDCFGGIVTHKRPGNRPRLVIQDTHAQSWNAIQVKGWTSDAFDSVNAGDWIYLSNVQVEDYKGTTFLQYKSENNADLTIISTNNPLPKPLVVSIDEIAAPIEGVDSWIVSYHSTEKYESMLIRIVDVYVKDTGYGKAYDNYLLTSNIDPNFTCWASDYMNNDKDSGQIYHPLVEIDQNFCGVTGILEQYNAESDGIYYDYYQLLTTETTSFIFAQIADLDGDCDVDFEDFCIFMDSWMMFEGK
jgi:hypothetical protein